MRCSHMVNQMTETPSRYRSPMWWQWLLGIGVPVTALFLAIALSYLLDEARLLIIFPLGLAGPGLIAGLGAVSLGAGRYLAYAVAIMSLLAWAIGYWSVESGNILIELLVVPLFLVLGLVLPVGFGVALGIAITQWRMIGVRAIHPLIVYLGIAVLALLVPIGGIIRLPSGHSDAAMAANFWQHREQFEQLARMSNEDTKMTRIADDFTNLESGSDLDFTESRWNQYRNIFQETGISGGMVRQEDGTIIFIYWDIWISHWWRRKGICVFGEIIATRS